MTNEKQLQTAYDSMTARCATLQNKVFSLQSEVAVFERENAAQSLSCSNSSNKWISVDDRLPNEDDVVLICYDEKPYGDSVGDSLVDTAHYLLHGTWQMKHKWSREVTHWMPLPEPPKPIEIDGIKKENE